MQDQYINHIMNETGATVSLRGRGSGNLESVNGEGITFCMQYDLIASFLLQRTGILLAIVTYFRLFRLQKDSYHCIYSCQVIIQKVLKMLNFWLKIFWIQSV